jgi:hypothetical protein
LGSSRALFAEEPVQEALGRYLRLVFLFHAAGAIHVDGHVQPLDGGVVKQDRADVVALAVQIGKRFDGSLV